MASRACCSVLLAAAISLGAYVSAPAARAASRAPCARSSSFCGGVEQAERKAIDRMTTGSARTSESIAAGRVADPKRRPMNIDAGPDEGANGWWYDEERRSARPPAREAGAARRVGTRGQRVAGD